MIIPNSIFEQGILDDAFFENWHRALDVLKFPALELDAFIMDESDPPVQAELARRVAEFQNKCAAEAANTDALQDDAGSEHSQPKWIKCHMDISESLGLHWPVPVPVELATNQWFKLCTRREQEVIVFAHFNGASFVDSSQNASRPRAMFNDGSPTIMPNQAVWSFEAGRFLIGRDCLALQGFPWSRLPLISSYSEKELQDLAGNMFSTTCYMAALIAMLSAWKKREDTSDLEATDVLKNLRTFSEEPGSEGDDA